MDRNCRVKFVGTRGSRTRDLSVAKVLCIARYTHILAHPCFQHLVAHIEFYIIVPVMCRHPSVESEASVTSLPAWCCTAHVRSMNWRMSVSVGAELGPVPSRVRRRSDEGKWGRRQAFTFIFGVCIHILDFLKLSVSSIVPTYFCFHFCFRHTGPVLNLRRLRCLRSGSYLL